MWLEIIFLRILNPKQIRHFLLDNISFRGLKKEMMLESSQQYFAGFGCRFTSKENKKNKI